MRRSTLSAVATGGALALLAGLAPAASAAPAAVDPAELNALRGVLAASDQSWAATGGSAVARCAFTMPAFSPANPPVVEPVVFRTTMRSTGARGATEIRTSSGSPGPRERVYVQGRKVVRQVPGIEKRALRKHGMASPPRWATVPRHARTLYDHPVSYSSDLALSKILAGDVTELTVTDGVYAGRVLDHKVESTFTVRTDGVRATDLRLGSADASGDGCRIRVAYDPQQVRVPKSATGVRAQVVHAESQLVTFAQSTLDPRNGRINVARLRWTAEIATAGTKVHTTRIPRGIAMTTKVKGWAYPLTWHVTVAKGKVTAVPVRTTR